MNLIDTLRQCAEKSHGREIILEVGYEPDECEIIKLRELLIAAADRIEELQK